MAATYEIRNKATGAIEQIVEGKAAADKIVSRLDDEGVRFDGKLVRYQARKVKAPAQRGKRKG